jgi:AraC-like DNA-binding protein
MAAVASPSDQYRSIHTDDLELVREELSKFVTRHRISRLERSTVDATLSVFRIDKLTLGRLTYGAAVKIEAEVPEQRLHVVQVPLRGTTVVACRSGREEVVTTPHIAALPDMRRPWSLTWTPDCEQIAVRVDDDQLTRHLQSLIGRPVTEPIQFELEMDLHTSRAQSWRAALDLLWNETQRPGGLLEHPLLSAQLESVVLTGLLLAQPHNYSAALRAEQMVTAPRPVKLVLERIEADPQQPLTIEKLAAEANVSVRALQQGFHELIGCSPMAYLREVRLNRARETLLSADPTSGANVTDIALDWGFMHLGRFSVEYRRRFGESPSQTLRR